MVSSKGYFYYVNDEFLTQKKPMDPNKNPESSGRKKFMAS